MTTDPNSDSTAGPSPDHGADQTAGPQQNAEPSPDVQTIDPRFRSPYTDQDNEALQARAPHYALLLQDIDAAVAASSGYRSLGAREALAGLKALEQARRRIELLSSDLLAHYHRIGDSAAHGYRSINHLLEGELRIPNHEARRRTHLSDNLTDRTSTTGEPLGPKRPAIAQHFQQGHLSADEARTLCKAVDDLPPSIHAEHADQIEETLVDLAPSVRIKDIPKLSQRIIEHIDPDGKLPQYETNPMAYTVTLIQKPNGDWRLSGLLDSPTGAVFDSLLNGRMDDADIPVTVKPHTNGRAAAAAAQADAAKPTADGAEAAEANGASETSEVAEVAEAAESTEASVGADATDGADAAAAPDTTETTEATEATEASVTSEAAEEADASDSAEAAGPGEELPFPDDFYEYFADSSDEEPAQRVPQVPLEVDWATWDLTVHADATVTVNGEPGTFLEDQPHMYLDEAGWPARLSEAATAAMVELLATARGCPTGTAHRVVREKILCRRPAGAPDDGTSPSADSGTGPSADSGAPPDHPDATHEAHEVSSPLSPGVFEDGTRNPEVLPTSPPPPGVARHSRLGFLLRCVTRQRVLHGADHALVVSATPEDLVHPRRSLSTQTGGPISLSDLEGWSNAAQTFAHITEGAGRTLEILSHGRFATRTQIAVLTARDQGCTFPDCDAPPHWCEAHHIWPYALGGPTTTDNLTLVCPFHHRWFEDSGWTSLFRNGLPAWRPPRSVDPTQRLLFHSRFRVALLNLPQTLPQTE